ncbi:hypothetical protein NQ314_005929 [Rhamnusium bicolor]|uniref:DUF4806 domain-containing protein n=1 Tax=Rhamnusium bicolor TaxID=1586634 RepID=A0AAV8ZE27_9CUCU|nr:hypothetical protein NQ314_005929 [Rhamnusium bicolor]
MKEYSSGSECNDNLNNIKGKTMLKNKEYTEARTTQYQLLKGADTIEKATLINKPTWQKLSTGENQNNFITEVVTSDFQASTPEEPVQFNKVFRDFVQKSCGEWFKFQKQVIKEIFLIKCIVKDNRETLVEMLLKNRQTEVVADNEADKTDLTQVITTKLPLIYDEDLQEVEEKLEDVQVFNALCISLMYISTEMALIGGNTVKDMTIKLMYGILSNKLGALYSWEGQKGKRVFKTLKLASLVISKLAY